MSFKSDFLKAGAKYIVAAVLILLAIALFPKHSGTKRVFLFPSVDGGKVRREVRWLPKEPVQGDLRMYVDELLLGSAKQGRLSLFSQGTACEFCFADGKNLFVGLSEDAALQLSGASDAENGIKLFRSNILKNFKYIDCVELFIDGNHVENR